MTQEYMNLYEYIHDVEKQVNLCIYSGESQLDLAANHRPETEISN